MKFKNIIPNLLKAVEDNGQPTNSMASVIRNYGKRGKFRPQSQLTGITYKAIDKIGLSISDYQIEIKKANGDPYTNHPLLTLFNKPNPNQTASDFHHLYAMLTEIYGETFWYKAKGLNSGQTKELYLLNPAQMEVCVEDGVLVGYKLHKANGEQVPFLPEEIHHDKRPNPFNEWRGMSVMEKAATYIDIEINTSNFTLNYISNSGSPSGIVTLPKMAEETFRAFTQQWRENYEGPENAGKTAFIRGEQASFEAVGATLKDIDQKITREMAKEDVLAMFDMPKGLLGMTDDKGMGRANVETLLYIFNSEKIDPMMKRLDRIYSALAADLPKNAGVVKIGHVSPIPEDKEYLLDTYDKGVGRWLTPNEIRERQGLEPLPGHDELSQIAPATTAPAAAKTVQKIVLKKAPTKSEQIKQVKADNEQFRKDLVETTDIYATKVKGEIAKFADQQEAIVIGNIAAESKDFSSWLFDIKEQAIKMAAAITPIIHELMDTQAQDVTNFITGELVTVAPELKKTVEADILRISGLYNEDTINALNKTLVQGQADGESLVKLKKRVEQVYTDAKGYRAERIARTESLRASNLTAEQVYKENGYSKVEWFINPGACEFCRTYAGRTKEIGGNFTNQGDVITGENGGKMRIEYSDIPTPPLHPNCTCSLVPAE